MSVVFFFLLKIRPQYARPHRDLRRSARSVKRRSFEMRLLYIAAHFLIQSAAFASSKKKLRSAATKNRSSVSAGGVLAGEMPEQFMSSQTLNAGQ